MQIAFILDIIVALLLVLTITYAVRLNQRLSQLRSDKNELLELAQTFADATVRAETSINQLKVSSEALQDDLSKAEALRDDLAYLVERGGRTADQMAESVRTPVRSNGRATPSSDMPRDTKGRSHDDEDDDQLIADAIRAVSPGVGAQGRSGGQRFSDDDIKPQDAAQTTRRVSSHPEQRPAASRKLGGGLGGLKSDDRLLGGPAKANEPNSVGDTDAARELLKALSSMK